MTGARDAVPAGLAGSAAPAASGTAPARSRSDDALAVGLGLAALGLAAASPWLVDRSGPDPFYKGPLIFPLLALAIAAGGALPSLLRLARGGAGRPGWRVDGRWVPWAAARLFALAALYPPAVAVFGLEFATFAFVACGLLVVGYGRPWTSLAVAAGLATVAHAVFVSGLDIWFPQPLVASLLADR